MDDWWLVTAATDHGGERIFTPAAAGMAQLPPLGPQKPVAANRHGCVLGDCWAVGTIVGLVACGGPLPPRFRGWTDFFVRGRFAMASGWGFWFPFVA